MEAIEQHSKAELIDIIRALEKRLTALEQRNAALERRCATLERRNAELERRNAALEAELDQTRHKLAAALKNSSNSSKPPSSDIVKPPKLPPAHNQQKRKIGGQPGHPRHEPPLIPPDQVDRVVQHRLESCPIHGVHLDETDAPPRVVQQIELVEKPTWIEEHWAIPGWCPLCQKVHYPALPPEIETGGLFGPRLTALVAYLKAAGHASISTIQRYLADVMGIKVSRGYIAKLLAKVSQTLKPAYEDLQRRLPNEEVVNVDETGHREKKRRLWTWCFRTMTYVLFCISESRGSEVLRQMLGEAFGGVVGCDYFSAYRKYMKDADIRVQFCLAHLIRELKFMATLPHVATADYAESLLLAIGDMFELIHRRDTMSQRAFERQMRQWRETILTLATYQVPDSREARNLERRFRKHGAAYFEFVTTPDVQPTNNLAEQAMRFVVIDRHITQGTRSVVGRQWCERIWTVMATCALQGRSAYEFLLSTIQASFTGQPAPLLVGNPS